MCTAILDGPSNEHHQMLTEFLESEDPELAFPPTLHVIDGANAASTTAQTRALARAGGH